MRAPLPRLVAATVLIVLAASGVASADHPQPSADVSKLDYSPIGHFKPGDPVPAPNAIDGPLLSLLQGKRFNPSGKYNAFDTNVFETLALPFRAAGDQSAEDPYGNGGDPRHGFCAQPFDPARPGPLAPLVGACPNHQLEYSQYFEETMRDILGDFGVSIRRYRFENPGSDNTLAGSAINTAAVVPGADHPEETVIVGAHFDQTTEGPASAWDSAEGHAQVIRMAKIMADYWRATGTRPSATVKFIPWDGEESGTLGSLDYATNTIVPGEEAKVRGYWNTDPCAGGYPAFRYGNPADRIDLGIQIADPEAVTVDTARIEAFNRTADSIVEQVFDRLDDELTLDVGKREIFISRGEAAAAGGTSDIGTDVNVGTGRPLLFSSDWANFEVLGIPFFNPGPEVTGPSNDGTLGNPDGIAILHTPNDNLLTINRLTGPGPSNLSGSAFSEGWAKGMEMCAALLSWGMLRADQGGAQTLSPDVVAYYEALPNEAVVNEPVTFDADGSYQYAALGTRQRLDEAKLSYSWDFGDGTTATGKTVRHRYGEIGVYRSLLTVRNTESGQSDTMRVPITVIPSDLQAPRLTPPPAEDADGTFRLDWTFDGERESFEGFAVEESRDFRTIASDDAEGDIAARWDVTRPENPAIQPWQASDSSTTKLRGNQRRSGARSYWTGTSPQDFRPTEVSQGESAMTLKETVAVPGGSPTLSYFSLFQNEGDDRGIVEVAVDDGRNAFEPVDTIAAVNTAAGQTDAAVCDPTNPATQQEGLVQRTADLTKYAGKRIRLRFRMVYGPNNRALSQPCGWYVDDVRVASGSFLRIATTPADRTTFVVADRPRGTFAYRIRGRYADDIATGSSNVEAVTVTRTDGGGSLPDGRPVGPEPRRPARGSSGCPTESPLRSVSARPSGRGVRFAFSRRRGERVHVDVFQASTARRVIGNRRVARFGGRTRGFRWSGRRSGGGRLQDGLYFVRFTARRGGREIAVRRTALLRRDGRFRSRRTFDGRDGCRIVRSFKLGGPAFGGRQNRPLGIAFRLLERTRVDVAVLRGGRVVHRFRTAIRRRGTTHRLTLFSERLARGNYEVRLTARTADGRRIVRRLTARRL